MGASFGQVLKWDGAAWGPGDDLVGDVNGPITSEMILDGEVRDSDLADGAVTASKLHSMEAVEGEVLKWKNGSWTPSADETDPIGPGPECAPCNQYIKKTDTDVINSAMIVDRAIAAQDLGAGSVDALAIAQGVIEAAHLGRMNATAGQVLKWNGAAWAPDEDDTATGNGGDVEAGDGLTEDPANTLNVGQGEGIVVSADAVAVDIGFLNGRFVNEGQANSITSAMIADNAVGSSKIASGAVGSSEVADNSLTASDLASNSVGLSELDASSGASGRFLKHTGGGMVWDTVSGGSLWSQNGSSIYYDAGNVGIRNSSPSGDLEVGSNSYGAEVDTWGPSNAPALRVRQQGGGEYLFFRRFAPHEYGVVFTGGWLDLGAQVAVEAYDWLDEAWRPMVASTFQMASSRHIKHDIRPLDREERARWLDVIANITPATYQYNWESSDDNPKPHLGLIAEELPDALLGEPLPHSEGNAVDMYALTTALVASVSELKAKLDEQADTIRRLEDEVARLRGE